jgi:hypothetical protein
MNKNMNKNKKIFANALRVIGICLVITGCIVGFSNLNKNAGLAFLICGLGTGMIFTGDGISNQIKNFEKRNEYKNYLKDAESKIDKRTEEIRKIFDDTESELQKIDGDNAFMGLQILSKYTKNLIQGAEHDIIYSISIEDAIELNITDEDLIQLAKLNWMIYEENDFACFV